MSQINVDLNAARNMFGPLAGSVRARLVALMDNPCEDTWNDAAGVILNPDVGLGLTLWQAVVAVDPGFAAVRGPVSRWVEDPDHENHGYSVPVSGWEQIPSPETIRQAIAYATR